jgi:hypothetical protein
VGELDAHQQRAPEFFDAEWVRIERVDPAHLEAWERLRLDLLRLQDAEPRVLQGYPMPDAGFQRPPVRIRLAATAEATAADLHGRYGDFLALTVGALPYPPLPPMTADRPSAHDDTHRRSGAPVDPAELMVALDGPLSVRSGETARHTVLVTNHSDETVVIGTNGNLTAAVVDPRTGMRVGGYAGAQHLPGISFRVAPSMTTPVPLLVGTASGDPALGYPVPAGEWALTVVLRLGDGRRLGSAPMPFTITA